MPCEISVVPLQFADAHLDQGNRPATGPHHIFVLIGAHNVQIRGRPFVELEVAMQNRANSYTI